jgi:hypothetical protein
MPAVAVSPSYIGTADDGKAAFSSFFELGPIFDTTSWIPYDKASAGGDAFCAKGGRKPSRSAGLATLDSSTWSAVWNEYVAFLQDPGTEKTSILLESYAMDKARSFGADSASCPCRDTVKYHEAVMPWCEDVGLDEKALDFGTRVRDLWRSTDGLPERST